MRKANTKIVKENISLLKEQKRKCFDIEAGIVDFKVVQETCREMDILLLPLYFVWEHMFKRNLCEVQFELHLKNSYSRFSLEPKRITLKILLLLFPAISENFSANTRKELLCIYLSIVNSIKESRISDASHAFGNCDGFQARALTESIKSNARHATGNVD